MEIMVGIKNFKKKEVYVDQQMNSVFDVSTIIGLTEDCTGSIVLSSTSSVPEGAEQDSGEPVREFNDGVCEMVNIIAGNASAELTETGVQHIERSLPNIIYRATR